MAAKTPPGLPRIDHHLSTIVQIVAEAAWLPNPEVVAKFSGAVFPTVRGPMSQRTARLTDGRVGMSDDNTTPRWALLWSHGFSMTSHHAGWTFAHVWDRSSDIEAYCHLANLVMIPEYYGSLTDKIGPLTKYLRYHSYEKYGWLPGDARTPEKPDGYDEVNWQYFDPIPDPVGFVRERLFDLENQRVKILREVMGLV